MKKILSFILSLIMVLGVITSVPVTVSAAMVNGDFEYEYIENNTEVTITKYVGSGGEVYIPNKIDGKYVTSISSRAFKDNSAITYVWMSNYVDTIEYEAFYNCTKLEEIDFGSGLKTIGGRAFSYCSSLFSVNLPDSLEEMSNDNPGIFQDCISLKSVVIGDGLKTVSENVFRGCVTLESVVFGSSVEIIGMRAFKDCKALNTLQFPDSLKSIGYEAFYNCTKLEEIDFGSGLKTIEGCAFSYCSSLVSVNLPDSLEEMSNSYPGVFRDCTALKSVVIGDGLKVIPESAFQGCTLLKNIVFGESVEIIGMRAFKDCKALNALQFPDSLKSIGYEAFYNCIKLEEIDFGSGLKTIEGCAFSYCSSLVSVNLPDSLEEMSNSYPGIFQDCISLKSVVLGDGLKIVPENVFRGCVTLESVVFGSSVEIIEMRAFKDCKALNALQSPDSLKSIGYEAFYNCIKLEEIDFGSGLKTIEGCAFSYCSSLGSVNLPDSLEEMSNGSPGIFQDCISLKSVVIGDGLKTVPENVFRGCVTLESVVFGSSVETIGRRVFDGCTNLKKTYFLGSNPTSVGDNNESLTNARWYHLPFEDDFSKGSVSTSYDTVSFDSNGGYILIDAVEEEIYTKYADNGKVAEPNNPQREGYTFVGWYDNANFSGEKVNVSTAKISKDITYYAKWEKNTYRIYFDPRGGKVSLGGKDVAYGEAVGQLPIPVLSGDTFNGWYLGMNSSGPRYTATTKMPAKDIVLYAGWENNDSATTVVFDTQGGSFIAPISVNSGDKISEPAKPTKTGYEFIGWYKEGNHSTKFDFEDQKINGNATLYALWKPNLLTAPAKVSVSDITDTTAKITWTEVAGAKAYNLYLDGELKTVVSSNQYKLNSLQALKKYTVSVTSVNSSGESVVVKATFETIHICTPSGWITDREATVYKAGSKHKECTQCGEKLKTETIPQLKCAKPTLKKVYNANSYVKVTWGAVEGADLYRVYRKTGTGDYEFIGSTTNKYFNDKEAGAGKTCRYRIRVKNEAGYSPYSDSLALKHIDEPTLKSIENSTYGVLIKWDKVTGAEKYNVYRKVSGGEYKYIGATSNTYYTDKTAKSGTKYYYAIRGKRDDSVSSQSASLSKYYLEDPTLNAPTSTKSGIKLSWSKVTGTEGYMVYRKTGSGSYSKLATVKGSTKVTYTDSSAKKGTKYYYKVKAYKSKTYSEYSNTKSVTDKY